jgi:hypothetical protein
MILLLIELKIPEISTESSYSTASRFFTKQRGSAAATA